MSYSPEQLLKIAANFEVLAAKSLVISADKKEKKKLDPKAKVRNRGTVCVPAEKAKDKKDHFPINDADQARNALARVHQYSSKPEWWGGSLSGLQALVARKVKAKYPKIDVGGKKEKKSSLFDFEREFEKYAQTMMTLDQVPAALQAQVQQLIQRLQYLAVNPDPSVKQRAASYVNTFMGHLMGSTGGQFNADFMVQEAGKAATLFTEIGEQNAAALAQAVGQALQAASQGQPPPSENQGTGTRAPQDGSSGAKPAAHKSRFPYIDPKVQAALNVSPDSQLGPMTQAALDVYKKNIGGAGVSNEQAIASIKQTSEYRGNRAMEYDDNANVYKPAGNIVTTPPF